MKFWNGARVQLTTMLLLILANCCTVAWSQTLTEKLLAEDPVQLAKQARRDGNIVRGAILFHQGNINCAKCHRATAESNRIGPDLSGMDSEATDEFVIESILQPSKQIKKGYETSVVLTNDGQMINGLKVTEDKDRIVIRDSANVDNLVEIVRGDIDEIRDGTESSMPQGLADELKNRRQFLDLLRYVIDVKERGPESESGAPQSVARRELRQDHQGLVQVQKLNCIACHPSAPKNQLPIAAKQAPRLAWSARRLNPDYIKSFVGNPHAIKPGTTMPGVFGALDHETRQQAATAITHYLLSRTTSEFQSQPTDQQASRRGFQLFHSVGCVACHSPRNELADVKWLDESTPLGNLANKYSVDGLTGFLEDPLVVRPSGHMPDMQLTHREANDISHYLLQSKPKAATSWVSDADLAEQGKTLFQKHQCASCHTEFADQKTQVSRQVALENLNLAQGCLSGTKGNYPDYHLDDQQRAAIRDALRSLPARLDDQQRIEVTLAAFNCIACHDRGDLGGVSPERNPHFQTTNLNLGDQGRIPPTLTGVGAKLKRKWLRDVMVNRRSIRPYMNTRMPQFGEQNIGHLFELLDANDQLSETRFASFDDQKAMREKGHLLAGNKGLNCVACHTFQYKKSDTMPAVDLTEMAERLKKEWFYQYMLAPQIFSPNTVMPSFWPRGQAIRKDIEGGPEDQIEAVWQYLIDGRQARPPSGIVREPLEIVVTDEARMLRRSYPGIGKRGIGVGYPGGENIAFDAEQMRLGAIWRGKFAEASGVWLGQGSGRVRPMARAIEFAKGPELDFANEPWIVDDGRPPNHQFEGYRLDKLQRPTFVYQFDSIQVEDFFAQVSDESGETKGLRRTVSMKSKMRRGDLRFRIASVPKITEANNIFWITDKLGIKVVSDHQPRVIDEQELRRLEIPIEIEPGQSPPLVIDYLWK